MDYARADLPIGHIGNAIGPGLLPRERTAGERRGRRSSKADRQRPRRIDTPRLDNKVRRVHRQHKRRAEAQSVQGVYSVQADKNQETKTPREVASVTR